MSVSELVFFACAAATLASACLSLSERGLGRAYGWLGLAIAAASGAVAPYGAQSLAAALFGMGVLVALLGPLRHGRAPSIGWRERASALRPSKLRLGTLALGLTWATLAFVLVSTMARQYVTHGAPLERRATYGEVLAPGSPGAQRASLVLHGAALLLVLAPVAVGLSRRREEARE